MMGHPKITFLSSLNPLWWWIFLSNVYIIIEICFKKTVSWKEHRFWETDCCNFSKLTGFNFIKKLFSCFLILFAYYSGISEGVIKIMHILCEFFVTFKSYKTIVLHLHRFLGFAEALLVAWGEEVAWISGILSNISIALFSINFFSLQEFLQ